MDYPEELLYHAEHLWVRAEGDHVVVGLTDFAQDQLGKIVYVDLPQPGDVIAEGDEMGAVESAKSVSDLIAPVNGEVMEINDGLNDDPSPINDDPYGAGWVAKVQTEGEPNGGLMTAEEYQERIA